MILRKLEDFTYESTGGKFDYAIRLDDESNASGPDNPWIVDVFDGSIRDNDKAHIKSESFDTFQEAIDFLFEEED